MDTLTIIFLALALVVIVFYLAHMAPVALGWGKLGKDRAEAPHGDEVFISVVIAARNESGQITRLLKKLAKQDYPSDRLEVIIVDDHSRSSSFRAVDRMLREKGFQNFRVISLKLLGLPGSKKNAISFGVMDANGELVLATDADCVPGKGWLRSYSRAFRASGATMLAGPVLLEPLKGFVGAFQELEFLSLVGSGAGAVAAGLPVFCNGANMAFKRLAFSEVRGYEGNEKYASGDDVFLLHKIKKRYGAGAIRFLDDRDAIIYTQGKDNWKEFLEQRIRWASKTRGYSDFFTKTLAVSVFSINLVMPVLLIAGIFKPLVLVFFAGLFILKMMADLPILHGITGFAGRRKLLWGFLLFEVVYIPYVIYVGIMSCFSKGEWKGRKI